MDTLIEKIIGYSAALLGAAVFTGIAEDTGKVPGGVLGAVLGAVIFGMGALCIYWFYKGPDPGGGE